MSISLSKLVSLIARNGIEPPTPAFSEVTHPVFPTTAMVAVGLPNTGRYEETEGPLVIAVGKPLARSRDHVPAIAHTAEAAHTEK